MLKKYYHSDSRFLRHEENIFGRMDYYSYFCSVVSTEAKVGIL